jgi:hypothetical protein
MKKKNLYIIIVLVVLTIIGFGLYFLNTSKKEIDQDHIRLNFTVVNKTAFSNNIEILKDDLMKPLLESIFFVKNNGTEDLFISSIEVQGLKYCIPAQGINCLRYDDKSPLNQSTYTSTSRGNDEISFFEKWNGGEQLKKIISALQNGDPSVTLPLSNEILNQQKSTFIDSLIICKECSDEFINANKQIVFKNAVELRESVNDQLENYSNKNDSKDRNYEIKIFVFDDITANSNTEDSDGDGILNNIDKCPNEKGLKKFNGCSDDDGDDVPNNEDQCPKQKGDKKCKGCPCPPINCPDNDNDGVCNEKDKCPNEFGKSNDGCPGCIDDRDKDGVCDEKDQCPDEKGSINKQGCPDQIILNINKSNATSNKISFKSSNYNFKDNDDIRVVIYHKGNRIGQPRKLVPSEIRIKEFSISGQSVAQQIGAGEDKLYIQLEFILNSKQIGKRSGNITIYCNQ